MNWLKWLFSKRYRQHRWARGDLSGFRRILRHMQSIKLPPRYPRGDPRNIDRVTAFASEAAKMNQSMWN